MSEDSMDSVQAKHEKTSDGQVSPSFKLLTRKMNNSLPALFTVAVCFALFVGWRLRNYELITPGRGTGYVLGILGTALMLTLLMYPLRKRIPGLEFIGNIKMWFRAHMVLGILGPVLILFHANFHLGSLNSNVALICMLIVSSSGIIGRYIYGRIHHGLYGKRAGLIELQKNLEQTTEQVDLQFALIPGIKEEITVFMKDVLVPSRGLVRSVERFLSIRWKSQNAHWKIQRITAGYLNKYASEHKWGFFRKRRMQLQTQRKTGAFLNQAVKVVEFNFYERLFSFWHMMHISLGFILAIAVVVHVIAVNRY